MTKEEKNQKELQEKYMEFKMLEQKVKEFQQHIQALETQINELGEISKSLVDMKNVKSGSEVLVPLNSGIFAKAKLAESNEVIVNVGAGVLVEKKVEDAKELVEKQIAEMKKMQETIIEQAQNSMIQVSLLQQELQTLVS